jgi:RecJ-like exonuclease
MSHIYSLRAQEDIDERIVGVVASILLSTGMLKEQKPFIASAHAEEGLIKVSARATEAMAKEGLDLGAIMLKAASAFEGRGGGHDIAAGAFLPQAKREQFMELVDQLVGEQFKS